MSVTRRSFVKGSSAGIGLGFAGLFPEIAAAKPQKVLPVTALQQRVISLARSDKRTASVLAKYGAYTFDWSRATAAVDDTVAAWTSWGPSRMQNRVRLSRASS